MSASRADVAGRLYRGLSRAAARGLASLGFVRSVYARRSVACGEARLPRSDLDLTVVIDPPTDLEHEVATIRALARRLHAMRRLLPMLGAAEVATPDELDLWYRAPWFPGSLERDRGWLRLWGEEIVLPAPEGPPARAWRRNLPWFFWAWSSLPRWLRARRVRTCCNLVLDMLNVALLGEGVVRGPIRRAALVDLWQERIGDVAQLAQVRAALRGRPSGRADDLLRWLHRQSVRIAHDLPDDDARDAVVGPVPERVTSRVPFSYGDATYVLVDPDDQAALDAAIDAQHATPGVVVTSARTLARYLRERNPWQWWCIADDARASFARPDDEAVRRAIRYYAHPTALRRLGLSIGTGVDRRDTIGPQYAQARLWLDRGFVASSRDELVEAWRATYGAWPYVDVATSDEFFARCYPILRRDVDELARRTGVVASAPDGPRRPADFA